MKITLPPQANKYIRQHAVQGFDELAMNLRKAFDMKGESREIRRATKNAWNDMKLGWKMFPRTIFGVSKLQGNDWKLNSDVVVYITQKIPIRIKKGYVLDFASVPRCFWWFISPSEYGICHAALLHDILYSTKVFSRRVSDAFFLEAMIKMGYPGYKAWPAFIAVRLFGWAAWAKQSKAASAKAAERFLEMKK